MVYLKPKQLIIKDCARRFVLKLYRHEASRGLFATAELLVLHGNGTEMDLSARTACWPTAIVFGCSAVGEPMLAH